MTRCQLHAGEEHDRDRPPAFVRVRMTWLSSEGGHEAIRDLCSACYRDKRREWAERGDGSIVVLRTFDAL